MAAIGSDAARLEPKLALAEDAFTPLRDRRLGGPLASFDSQLKRAGELLPGMRENLGLLASLGPAWASIAPAPTCC